jgi:hypothetical protein
MKSAPMTRDAFFPTLLMGACGGVAIVAIGLFIFSAGKESGKDFCIAHPSECQASPLSKAYLEALRIRQGGNQ